MAILRYLLKHGARPVVADENQLTPLMLAGECGLKYTSKKLSDSSLAIYSLSQSAHLKIKKKELF